MLKDSAQQVVTSLAVAGYKANHSSSVSKLQKFHFALFLLPLTNLLFLINAFFFTMPEVPSLLQHQQEKPSFILKESS